MYVCVTRQHICSEIQNVLCMLAGMFAQLVCIGHPSFENACTNKIFYM